MKFEDSQEILIACDANGNPVQGIDARGRESSKVERGPAHRFGITHLALTFTYKNSKNQIYLAQRAARRDDLESQRIPTPFGDFWDASGAGHYRWSDLVGNALVDKKTRIRCELAEELGVQVEPEAIRVVGTFGYSSLDPNYRGSRIYVKESEVCYLAVIFGDHEPQPNSDEISKGEWIGSEALQKQAEDFVTKYVVHNDDSNIINIIIKNQGVRRLTCLSVFLIIMLIMLESSL